MIDGNIVFISKEQANLLMAKTLEKKAWLNERISGANRPAFSLHVDDLMNYLPTNNACINTDAEWSIWTEDNKLLCSDNDTASDTLDWICFTLDIDNYSFWIDEENGVYRVVWVYEKEEDEE